MDTYFTVVAYIMASILGLCVGSFLNVVIYRVPNKMSLAYPPSHCTTCDYTLKWYDNIPVLSYIMLGGRCRGCKSRISPRYMLVEIFNAFLWVLSVLMFWEIGVEAIIYTCMAAVVSSVLVCIFFIDLEHMLIFNRFTVTVAVCGLIAAGLNTTRWYDHLIGGAAGAIVFLAIYYGAILILKREGLGFGDVKLAAAAGLLLGVKYDTGDVTGTVIEESDEIPDSDKVFEAIASFVGKGQQIPPMYSALKVDGQKLVNLARKGKTVERKPRDIEIYSIDAEGEGREYKLKVHCSKGTYMRTLCEDIGERLGCPATMSSLRRFASGNFELTKGYTIDELREMEYEDRVGLLLPTESLFEELPMVTLNGFFLKLFRSGQEIYQKKIKASFPVGQRVRVYDENGFFALGEVMEYDDGTAIKSIKQFVLEEK